MKKLALLIPVVLILTASSVYGLEITISEKTTVEDKYVTLGNVADFSENSSLTKSLAGQVIAKSPKPGHQITLVSNNIIKTIYRKTSLSRNVIWKGSSTVTILREGQRITHDDIVAAVSMYIESRKKDLPKANISFLPGSLPIPFMVPKGKIDWEILPANPALLSTDRFSIILRVNDRVRKNFSIAGRIQAFAPIAVATTSLRRGEILTPANTAMVEKDIAQQKQPCFSLRKILGKRMKHAVKAGKPILASHIEHPPLVYKGQLVKIILHQGPLYLSATGIARMSGKENDMIRVQNTSSKKLIFGRVTAPGIVEVTI